MCPSCGVDDERTYVGFSEVSCPNARCSSFDQEQYGKSRLLPASFWCPDCPKKANANVIFHEGCKKEDIEEYPWKDVACATCDTSALHYVQDDSGKSLFYFVQELCMYG